MDEESIKYCNSPITPAARVVATSPTDDKRMKDAHNNLLNFEI